jgi:hypothetical protein
MTNQECQSAVNYVRVVPGSYRPIDSTNDTPVITTSSAEQYVTETTKGEEGESRYFEMLEEEEVRKLLNDIFLWLSGMGEYPELLAQIAPESIIGDAHSNNEDERDMVPAKTVAQVLRWVLGEI